MAPRETENNAYEKFRCYGIFWSGQLDSANFQPIRNTSQIWVVKRHQYKEFLRSFLRRHRGDTRDSVATRRLLSHAKAKRE